MTTNSPTVLLVEDECLVCCEIAEDLRRAGFIVHETASAEDAIEYAQSGHRIDVVFTDIDLKGRLTGWDVAERIRAIYPEVRIVYASGHAIERSRRVADSLFFDKPYNCADVVKACRSKD